MANREGFGSIVERDESHYGNQVMIKFDDGRESWIHEQMIRDNDTGDGLTRFCTEWAYRKKKKEQVEAWKKEAEAIMAGKY